MNLNPRPLSIYTAHKFSPRCARTALLLHLPKVSRLGRLLPGCGERRWRESAAGLGHRGAGTRVGAAARWPRRWGGRLAASRTQLPGVGTRARHAFLGVSLRRSPLQTPVFAPSVPAGRLLLPALSPSPTTRSLRAEFKCSAALCSRFRKGQGGWRARVYLGRARGAGGGGL